MSHCLILQHDAAFGAGRILPIFRDFGIPTRFVRLDLGEPVPTDFDEARIVVLLGGSHRLTGADEFSERPDWLDAEIEVIGRLVEEDRPMLGMGLGAEIIAAAAGAKVTPNTRPSSGSGGGGGGDGGDGGGEPAPYFGLGPVALPFPGGTDPIAFGLADGTPMFFWQRDTFELPKLPPPPGHDPSKPGPPPPSGNQLIFSTRWCRNAGFRFRNRIYGLAFHAELDQDELEPILERHGRMAEAALGSGALDRLRADIDRGFERYQRLGTRLLQNFVQYSKTYNP